MTDVGFTTGPVLGDLSKQADPATVPFGAFEGQDWFGATKQVIRGLSRQGAELGVYNSLGVQVTAPEAKMPAEAAQAKYGIADPQSPLKFDQPVPESVAQQLNQAKRDELDRRYIAQVSPGGFANSAERLGAGFVSGALDPLNIAASFIPVVGEARYAAMLEGAGSAIGRAGVRAGIGTAQGLAGQIPLTALRYGLSKEEQADYSATDAMLDIAYGGLLGGGLHTAIGGIGDAISGRFRATPAAAEADNSLNVREGALRTAIGAVAEDHPVQVEPIFDTSIRQRLLGTSALTGLERPADVTEHGVGPREAQILQQPEVQQAINEPREIDRTHDVPYLAGSNDQGGVTYIDRRVPEQMDIGGQQVDPAKYLNVHEQTEHALMTQGNLSYAAAHEIATGAERRAVEADGVDWDAYQKAMLGLAKNVTEGEKPTNPPPDLYTKPYPHEEAEFLQRRGGQRFLAPAEPIKQNWDSKDFFATNQATADGRYVSSHVSAYNTVKAGGGKELPSEGEGYTKQIGEFKGLKITRGGDHSIDAWDRLPNGTWSKVGTAKVDNGALEHIVVSPDYRGRGIAAKLTQEAEDRLDANPFAAKDRSEAGAGFLENLRQKRRQEFIDQINSARRRAAGEPSPEEANISRMADEAAKPSAETKPPNETGEAKVPGKIAQSLAEAEQAIQAAREAGTLPNDAGAELAAMDEQAEKDQATQSALQSAAGCFLRGEL